MAKVNMLMQREGEGKRGERKVPRNLLLAHSVPGLWSLCIPLVWGYQAQVAQEGLAAPGLVQFWEGRGVFPSHQTPQAQRSHPRGDPGALNPGLQRRKVAH